MIDQNSPLNEVTDLIETPDEPGSSPLHTAKHEIFAQRVARGVSKSDAYIVIGFKANAGNAGRLAARPEVAQRILWLKEQAAKAAVFDAGWIKRRMGELADAVSEIVIDPSTGVRKPGPMYNGHVAARTLELLGREAGIFKDKIELGGHVQVANADLFRRMSSAERATMRAMLAAAAGRAPEAANDDGPAETEQGGLVPAKKYVDGG